jgi:hypothetical protein
MQRITFITLATPGKAILKALMMAASLRSFGGQLRDSPIKILVPETMNDFSEIVQDNLSRLKAQTVPLSIDLETLRFPFTLKIHAAAHAEAILKGDSERMTWLDCDSIILREPSEFLLPAGTHLGYRPVHHKLIGPTWGEPLNPFWKLIYQYCGVLENRQFQMTTHTGEKTRPYFNAGTFVIRPSSNLMGKWWSKFTSSFNQPEFQTFYKADNRYAIFMHQAVFTGVLLSELEPVEMVEFGPKINYPLHLHSEIPDERRPTTLNDLITLRYENLFDTPDWQEDLSILKPLMSWLEAQPLIQN